jgi:dipeptidyl aminopeptidase/acylaminoacyl peptidase
MQILKNFPIPSNYNRPIVTDLFYKKTGMQKPLVIYIHGYKGYKDWGIFGKMNHAFLAEGFALLKFNFSHNGGTVEDPIDFPDLDAFGKNTYSMELDDVQTVINWICNNAEHYDEIDINNITLIGHSRGGGMATLTAASDPRIKKVVTWAAVSTLNRTMFQDGPELEQWKESGVFYIVNGRTKQQMPHYISFYEDYIQNQERLNVENAARNINIPHLIIHGDGDDAVPFSHAENLHAWNPKSKLINIPNSNHVFEGKHPWEEESLPKDFEEVLEQTLAFLANT